MSLSTMTSKGQVTIPKEVREFLQLGAGDQIEITLDEGSARIRPLSKKAEAVFGMLKTKGQKALSIEEMDEAVGKKFQSKGV